MRNAAKLMLSLIVVAPTTFTSPLAAEEIPNSMEAITFEYKDGQTQTWRRPPEARFAIVSGCGGGAGGSAFYQELDNGKVIWTVPGHGGANSPVETIVIPLSADKYEVLVGQGGAGGRDAANPIPYDKARLGHGGGTSEFRQGPLVLTFSGAPQAKGLISYTVDYKQTDGHRSILGPGGTGSKKKNGTAENAPSKCAGGGGLGTDMVAKKDTRHAGHGGHGFVTIIPIPDLARFGRVLSTIEELSQQTKIVVEQPADKKEN